MSINLSTIPTTSGVYLFLDKNKSILYIGKAINLRKRVRSYFQKNILSVKTKQMVSYITHVKTIKTESEFDALLLEAKLIHDMKPKYNVVWRDDKHPLYIKITKEKYPKITTSRKEDDAYAIYFGPFPSSKIVRKTLRIIRKIFPYCSEKTMGKRACFYHHIGLCSPCPNEIEKLKGRKKIEKEKEYQNNISMIKKTLEGKSSIVIKMLEKNMRLYAKKAKFEKANYIKHQIEMLMYLRQDRTPIHEYLSNPNLYEDLRIKELKELSLILNISTPKRIEGYDISNIQGTFATGSMVVFLQGEPEKSLYRRFRIQTKQTKNDPYMIGEILHRRLQHHEWDYPDLIMVDGGKEQVKNALKALSSHTTDDITIIGLAKRYEEIILYKNRMWKTIVLPKNSPALQLLQRVRDEAHRFANWYHKKLRLKHMKIV